MKRYSWHVWAAIVICLLTYAGLLKIIYVQLH